MSSEIKYEDKFSWDRNDCLDRTDNCNKQVAGVNDHMRDIITNAALIVLVNLISLMKKLSDR